MRPVVGQGALDDVGGELVLAADVVQRGDRGGGFDRAAIDAGQQLLGLLEPALSQPELGQPDECRFALALGADRPEANGVGEGGVGFGPAPGRGEQTAVVGSAERRHVGDLAAGGDRLADPDPLVGPADVVGVLARREQLAEHLGEDEEVVDLASGDAGEGLVEVDHALIDAVVVHEGGAEVGEGVELEVAGAVAAGQLDARRGSACSRSAAGPANMPLNCSTQPASAVSSVPSSSVWAREIHPPMTARSPRIIPCR